MCNNFEILLNTKPKKAEWHGRALSSQNPLCYLRCTAWLVIHFLPSSTEKNQLFGPNKRDWAEILGIGSSSPNLILDTVLVNPIGSSK